MIETLKNILIVDSNLHVNHHLKRLLESHGYFAEQAFAARETFARLNAQVPPFDLLIIDVQLQDMDGISAIIRIRDLVEYQHTAIMILTADSKSSTVSRAISAGVVDYITKPFDDDDVLYRINRALGGASEDPREELNQSLRKEINRCNRSGTVFSLVLMQGLSPAISFPDQVRLLREKLREIDQILVFSNFISILLPLTDEQGVQVVINKIANLQSPHKWLYGHATFPLRGHSAEEIYHGALETLSER